MSEKLEFASAAWIEEACAILQDLVTQHGEVGETYSVCEIFTDAPLHVAASGTAAWYFYIEGASVRTGTGIVEDTDVTVRVDYRVGLDSARLVYTPELRDQAVEASPEADDSSIEGDITNSPPYLLELHNRLAVRTA